MNFHFSENSSKKMLLSLEISHRWGILPTSSFEKFFSGTALRKTAVMMILEI